MIVRAVIENSPSPFSCQKNAIYNTFLEYSGLIWRKLHGQKGFRDPNGFQNGEKSNPKHRVLTLIRMRMRTCRDAAYFVLGEVLSWIRLEKSSFVTWYIRCKIVQKECTHAHNVSIYHFINTHMFCIVNRFFELPTTRYYGIFYLYVIFPSVSFVWWSQTYFFFVVTNFSAQNSSKNNQKQRSQCCRLE